MDGSNDYLREPSPATDLDGIMACQGWGLEVARTGNSFVTEEHFGEQLEFAPLHHYVQAAIAEVLKVANESVFFHADAQRREIFCSGATDFY